MPRVKTIAFRGLQVLAIDVQIQISSGLPSFNIVGLPDKSIAESRDRIRAAMTSIGIHLPSERITVNLSPADLLKEGSHYDLPIVMGILTSMKIIPEKALEAFIILGEIALDGRIEEVSGVLAAALYCVHHRLKLVCPHVNGGEAAYADQLEVLAPPHLLDLLHHFKGSSLLPQPLLRNLLPADCTQKDDLSDVKGQSLAKRALYLSAAGHHHLLLSGPPGAGKSMLAHRLIGLLPPLTKPESLEVSVIHSITGDLKGKDFISSRPFRAPHHSCSQAALVGGGSKAKPGEISLAHRGVLFLDELPEFPRATLEALRQPLESGQITIARANCHAVYPAKFYLIAAMNPCPCGYLGNLKRQCKQAPRCAETYARKLSGPLLDRFDMKVDVRPVSPQELASPYASTSTEMTAQMVSAVQMKQKERQGCLNGELTSQQMDQHLQIKPEATTLLVQACEKMEISGRGFQRIKRLSRTIADTEDSLTIERHHVAEALTFRLLEI